MADYITLLVPLCIICLSMAATGRCSWISGGAPPPASEGDYVNLGDDDLLDVPSPSGGQIKTKGKHKLAPGPSGEFIVQGKEEVEEEEEEEEEEEPDPESIKGSQDGSESKGSQDGSESKGSEDASEKESGKGKGSGKESGSESGSGSESASGPASAEGPASSDGEFIVQEKESVESGDQFMFIIQGKVYCDPCRIQFPTKISYPLPETKIILLCHKEDSDEETYRLEGMSDNKGRYVMNAMGDHPNEICEITVAESPDPKCPELMDDENHVRVTLTNKHGAKGNARFANPLGFMVTDADPRCKEVLDELGFTGI